MARFRLYFFITSQLWDAADCVMLNLNSGYRIFIPGTDIILFIISIMFDGYQVDVLGLTGAMLLYSSFSVEFDFLP